MIINMANVSLAIAALLTALPLLGTAPISKVLLGIVWLFVFVLFGLEACGVSTGMPRRRG